MEIQPPPGAPAPPPSIHADRSRRRFSTIIWMGVVCIAVMALLATQVIMVPRMKHAHFVQTLGNARQIGLALLEFEMDYGKFPDAATLEEVRSRSGTSIPLGTTTSNEYLRQLLVTGNENERIFQVSGKGSRRPDDDILGVHALEKGECGFAYIPGLSSSSAHDLPVLIGPLISGTDKADRRLAEGRVIALFVDGSSNEMKTDRDGHVLVRGKRLLDPANSIWEGRPPTLVWPE